MIHEKIRSKQQRVVKSPYHANMSIDGRYPIVRTRFQQLAGQDFLDGQDDTIITSNANDGSTILDRFHGVFDLEIAAIRGEDGVGKVIACADGGLCLRIFWQ